jgi:hypothetical protein
MEKEILKKFEGKRVKLFLKNNFVYSQVVFKITENELLEFQDKYGEVLTIEPSFVNGVTVINEVRENEF